MACQPGGDELRRQRRLEDDPAVTFAEALGEAIGGHQPPPP
jgi:hypothetical protein